MDNILTVLGVIALVSVAVILSFGCTFALVYGICWAFGLTFSWKVAFGIWLVLILINFNIKITKKE